MSMILFAENDEGAGFGGLPLRMLLPKRRQAATRSARMASGL
jgi:hypothetical protein